MMKALPKTLQKLITDHPDKFSEGWSELDGFNETGGYAHWLYLKRGWHNGDEGSHIIHECTVREVKDAFRRVGPCNCVDCRPGSKTGWWD